MSAFAHCLFHHASNVADVAEQQMWHGFADDETTWNVPEFFTGWRKGCDPKAIYIYIYIYIYIMFHFKNHVLSIPVT